MTAQELFAFVFCFIITLWLLSNGNGDNVDRSRFTFDTAKISSKISLSNQLTL